MMPRDALAVKPYTFVQTQHEGKALLMLEVREENDPNNFKRYVINERLFTSKELKAMLEVAVEQKEPLAVQQHIVHAISARASLILNGVTKFDFNDAGELTIVSFFNEENGIKPLLVTTTSHSVKELDYMTETAKEQKESKAIQKAIRDIITTIMAARREKRNQQLKKVKRDNINPHVNGGTGI